MNTKQILKLIDERKKDHEALATGFNQLDKPLPSGLCILDGGFFKKELVIIGAHTGIGKSLIAGQIFYNIAQQGYKCAYLSLEISNEMVVSRIVGSIANIKPTRVRFGWLTDQERQAKLHAEAKLLSLDDLVDFYDDLYELEQIEKLIKENDYEFIVIDFIQNIMDKISDEYSRLSKVALTLQKLAKEKNCCILALSQLSNRQAKEGSKATTVEYKGSGAIAMVCDLGFMLERNEHSTNMNKLWLRKNRRGISGSYINLEYKEPGGWLNERNS